MSQFDFPRINFSGRAFVNPGTANNNVWLPLVLFDPVRVKPVLPPRVYLSDELLQLHQLGGLPLPEPIDIQADERQLAYVEIKPIHSRDTFHEWAKTPLGQCPLDAAYHALYDLVRTKRTQKPLTGHLPGSWNFFGGMEFGLENVQVKSVALRDGTLFTPDSPNLPEDIGGLLGATLDMNTDRDKTAAVMIDVVPSLALFSQVFCDSMRLHREGHFFFKGKPRKGALRFLNTERIVNQEGVEAGSGTFFSVIPEENIDGLDASPILRLFQKYGHPANLLRGIFIRYNLFEVWENQEPDYRLSGREGNPARMTVAGSISPWYEGDLASIGMGRLLVSEHPFSGQKKLAPLVCRIEPDRQCVTMDWLSSVPETISPDGQYDTYPLGELALCWQENEQPDLELGRFRIDPEHYSRETFLQTGGLIELLLPQPGSWDAARLDRGGLVLRGPADNGQPVLLREHEWMLASEQAGIYAEEGQLPGTGFRNDGPDREPCAIRIYRRGRPLSGSIPLRVMALRISAPGATASVQRWQEFDHFRDRQHLDLPCEQATNAMFVLYPGPSGPIPVDLMPDIQRFGFFISLRVLPRHDYGRYLDPEHPDYPTPVTFEVLYEELLRVYDQIYPVSSLITPFTEAYFRKGWKFLYHRMSPANWGSAGYMPSSRDMSADQWALFERWAGGQ